MATIAIGDVHGNLPALRDLLRQLRAELVVDDTVVFLGDYIDRGCDSKACVDAILALRAERSSEVICLCGNHEDWLLQTLRDPAVHAWLLAMDGFTTIRSYSPVAEQVLRQEVAAAGRRLYEDSVALGYEAFFNAMPPDHRRFFESLARYHRDLHGIYVHAGLDARLALSQQTRESVTLGWDDDGFPEGYGGEELVLYGHRNNATVDVDGWPNPRRIGRTIGLDTSRHGVITAIRLPDQRVFQSRRFATEAE
jgi:serine/threonine protein phosphatase 1